MPPRTGDIFAEEAHIPLQHYHDADHNDDREEEPSASSYLLLPEDSSFLRRSWALNQGQLIKGCLAGAIVIFLAAAYLTAHADSPCPLSCVEGRLATTWKMREMLMVFVHSWLAAMPCFPKMHLIVPNSELDLFRRWIADNDLPNFVAHPENLPSDMAPWIRRQWSDFMADEIGMSPWIMAFDSDVMWATPVACNALFDEDGKPYSLFWDGRYQWPDDGSILKLAKQNFPNKWSYTVEEVDNLATLNWMSYFPVVWPRWLTPIVRELISDSQGGIGFENAMRQLDHISQFDLFGKAAFLLYHDVYHWLRVPPPYTAFGAEAQKYAEVHNFSVAAVHLSYPHQFGQAPLPDYPDQQWIAYAAAFARHLLCTRERLPQINSYSIRDLFRSTILRDWDGNCSASPDLAVPFKEVALYNEGSFDGHRWVQEYLRDKASRRRLCTDAVRKQTH